MSFLTINGIAINVAVDSAKKTPKEVGERSDAFDGTPLLTRQRIKLIYEMQTVALSKAEAHALERLLLGAGHHWSFDSNVYSSNKGLGPSSSTGATVGAVAGKFGNLLRLAASTGAIAYPGAVTEGFGDWTIIVWRFESGAWHHYVIRSDGAKWLDGVSTAVATTWLTVTSGTVAIANTTLASQDYDDLVALPFVVPSSWAAQIYAFHNARAFSDLRRLTIAGDVVQTAPATVIGEVTGDAMRAGVLSGVRQPTRALSFRLEEV